MLALVVANMTMTMVLTLFRRQMPQASTLPAVGNAYVSIGSAR